MELWKYTMNYDVPCKFCNIDSNILKQSQRLSIPLKNHSNSQYLGPILKMDNIVQYYTMLVNARQYQAVFYSIGQYLNDPYNITTQTGWS